MCDDSETDHQMTRDEYLRGVDVVAFIDWLGGKLDVAKSFPHCYIVRKTGAEWNCDCLYSAFLNYRWPFGSNGRSFEENKADLEILQKTLRNAVKEHNGDAACSACRSILSWGGVSARNGKWIDDNKHEILKILETDSALLCAANPSEMSLQGLHRFNAGIVKIYALLLDDFIIYDGRVGAALGLLVREWCVSTKREFVPAALSFPWGAPKETQFAKDRRKNRNPSRATYHFPQLTAKKEQHALWTIFASWLLKGTLDRFPSQFNNSTIPMRSLEAALFMVGYDLG